MLVEPLDQEEMEPEQQQSPAQQQPDAAGQEKQPSANVAAIDGEFIVHISTLVSFFDVISQKVFSLTLTYFLLFQKWEHFARALL